MLNCYNLYAIVWIAVMFFYDLGWSDYCQPLNIYLRVFIYFSIVISFFLGYIFRNSLKYKRANKALNIGNRGTVIICVLQAIEYWYCRTIPIFDVILHGGNYAKFGGIPTFHVILYTYSTFYTQYLFYGFLNERKKSYLRNYFLILFFVYGLQFMRGGLTICLAISAVMFLSSVERKIKLKHIVISIMIGLFVVYVFGGIGNIREGATWNDSSAFFRFGRINKRFPQWLPNQFAWVYCYIVGSLATLNYNILAHNSNPSVMLFLQSMVPDFIRRRIWPQTDLASAKLIWKGFTTTTGYFRSYYYGGVLGMYIMYIILIAITVYITRKGSVKEKFRALTIANMGVIIALFFFTNAIENSAISFSIIYPIFFSIVRKKMVFVVNSHPVFKAN